MSGHAQNLVCARRAFLRGVVRYTLLGGIISAAAATLINGHRSGRSCRRQFLCGACPLSNECSLSEAAIFRNRSSEVEL